MTDVAILLGSPDASAPEWPGGAGAALNRANGPVSSDYNSQLIELEQHLIRSGYLPKRLLHLPPLQTYEGIPEGVRAVIVPDRAQLTAADREAVERFTRSGGTVIAMRRGGALASANTPEPQRAAAIFGVSGAGDATAGFTVLLDSAQDVRGPVAHLKPVSATPLIWANHPRTGDMPFLTRNTAGAGRAFLIGSPEWALVEKTGILDYLWKEAIGDPVWRMTVNPERYTVRIRRQPGRYVVHVIDNPAVREGPMARYRPLYTRLALNSRLVRFERATIVPDGRTLQVTADGVWKTMELFPDPELTIVLQ